MNYGVDYKYLYELAIQANRNLGVELDVTVESLTEAKGRIKQLAAERDVLAATTELLLTVLEDTVEQEAEWR